MRGLSLKRGSARRGSLAGLAILSFVAALATVMPAASASVIEDDTDIAVTVQQSSAAPASGDTYAFLVKVTA
jgi:hypothetical protein